MSSVPLSTAEPSEPSGALSTPLGLSAPAQWGGLITWQGAVIGLLLLLGELPLLLKFFADLWSRPQYQFYPVALIAAGYIFWQRVRETPVNQLRRGSAALTMALLAISWIVLAAGLLYLRWMAPVSAWILLAAAVWWIGGRPLIRAALPAGILLLIIIPPPAHWDELIGNQLRVVAVHASSRVLDLISLPHVISGTVIEIPHHRLLVEEACSGINSLMSVIAFTILYGIWQRRGAWFTLVLTVAAAGFVLAANIVRITIGAVLVQYWKIDILSGTSHELLGLVLFGISLGLVISFDWFLLMIWKHRGLRTRDRVVPDQQKQQRRGGGLLWWPAAIAFLVLGIALQARVGHAWAQSRLRDDAKFTLPTSLAGWELVRGEGMINGRPETEAARSNFWVYRLGPMTAAVALNYPFDGFHDATICYATSGWTIDSRTPLAPAGNLQNGYIQVQMNKRPMMQGQLLFAQFDEHGMAPPVTPKIPAGAGRLQRALILSRQKAAALPTYQVQTLSIDYSTFSSQQQAALRSLFRAARAELARQVMGQLEGKR